MNKTEAYSIKDFNCNDFTLGNCTDDENLIWENNQVSLNLHRSDKDSMHELIYSD